MSAFRQWENDLRFFLQSEFVRGLVSLYVEKNPEAADDPDLVMHAVIWPLCLGAKHSKERGGWSEQDSWRGFEHLLLMGASKGGVRLSPLECKFLLQIFSGERKLPTWRGRHAHKRALLRSHAIAVVAARTPSPLRGRNSLIWIKLCSRDPAAASIGSRGVHLYFAIVSTGRGASNVEE